MPNRSNGGVPLPACRRNCPRRAQFPSGSRIVTWPLPCRIPAWPDRDGPRSLRRSSLCPRSMTLGAPVTATASLAETIEELVRAAHQDPQLKKQFAILHPVPSSPQRAPTKYDVSQAMSYVARSRNPAKRSSTVLRAPYRSRSCLGGLRPAPCPRNYRLQLLGLRLITCSRGNSCYFFKSFLLGLELVWQALHGLPWPIAGVASAFGATN